MIVPRITCPNCGNIVAQPASTCPLCGQSLKGGAIDDYTRNEVLRWVNIGLMVLIASLPFVGVGLATWRHQYRWAAIPALIGLAILAWSYRRLKQLPPPPEKGK